MNAEDTRHRIVWHDLVTGAVPAAMRFYEDLLGWEYLIEHSTDFVWRSGEADYPLIMADHEAHGGFVNPGIETPSYWLPFVTVDEVDAAVERATGLGGTIERAPFDIPGVGRSAVLHDPDGAAICPFVPSHGYPQPKGLFTRDQLFGPASPDTAKFYAGLFGWEMAERRGHTALATAADSSGASGWIPWIATADIDTAMSDARSLDCEILLDSTHVEGTGHLAMIRAAIGGVFCLHETG
ncbi:VOC family protein [Parasphingopyxis algicola]|uniref:VOC family protein n=1 Tax=Parasphingopyxis algicola TaxID=2026624 RepID=UPI0015A116C6|nr:VOC family protein [Parasphingopyxis algicola]QLC24246.1 VOC family protein [Parasphingopyxis algicola]